MRTYKIIGESGATTSFNSSDKIIKRVVKNDTYQVVVQQGAKNFFAIQKTRGLLRTTSINVSLVAEKSRSFVGNNPSPCSFYNGDAMFSASCDDSAYRIEKHLPASGYTPSYSSLLPTNSLFGDLGGVAITKSGDAVALLKDTEGVAGYSLQRISPELVGADRVRIGALDPSYRYEMRPYMSGVLVYESTRADYFYINPETMSSIRLRPEPPHTTGLSPASVRTHKDDIAILYTDTTATESLNPENDMTATKDLPGTSEVIIYANNKQRHIVLPKIFSTAITCAQYRLCAINSVGMTVYDVKGSEPKQLYTIPGIVDVFETSSSSLRIVSSLGIMSYDPLRDSGSYDYTFGDYRLCGFSPAANDTYLLCLIDTRQEKIGLLVEERETTGVVPIDKIVLNVLRSKAVSSVSVYKNLVIVTPEYYDQISGRAIDEASVKKNLKAVIDKMAFPNDYTVVNSAEL
ncbi:hypothetical protein IPP75_04325 [Candidatus Saccharibacteria bacterium]|nr:MAG: hypothetical protein IPP75_04325 [Candidatus Saccharibacteria bacterium]